MAPAALAQAYANLLGPADNRALTSYGGNGPRLARGKGRYDPANVFSSAIPLPLAREGPTRPETD